jgi:hypothetical protein
LKTPLTAETHRSDGQGIQPVSVEVDAELSTSVPFGFGAVQTI